MGGDVNSGAKLCAKFFWGARARKRRQLNQPRPERLIVKVYLPGARGPWPSPSDFLRFLAVAVFATGWQKPA